MKTRAFLLAGVAALSVLGASAAPAHATIDTCAFVKPTPDGFLNLRAEPKMGAKIIRRLKPGQELVVVAETTHSPWTRVDVIMGDKKTEGKCVCAWASSRFLRFFQCDDND
jgi:Bacterial SH3 domain